MLHVVPLRLKHTGNHMATDLIEYFTTKTDDIVGLLRQIVELESPTHDKPAVDQLGTFLEEQLAGLGAQVERVPQPAYGDHLIARLPGPSDQPPALLLAHMDTVWPVGTLATMPWREKDGMVYGPGAFDMKGGIAIGLFALRAISDLGLKLTRPVVWLFNSDEEIGSPTSRPFIEEEARRSAYAMVLEPAVPPDGALKTSRKGVARFNIRVTGKAAHAGAAPEEGVSAIEELARLILELHALTDHQTGTTVNVGVIEGGTRSNVVAAEARAEVDLRVANSKDGERLVAMIYDLRAQLPGTQVNVTGGMNRPPMERTPAIAALFERARHIAAELDLTLTETGTGGGSDGNFTAALGVPTLDGLGAVGDGGHALHEQVIVASLPQRAALLAALLTRL